MYKSTDAGATWPHIGLDTTKQIPSIARGPARTRTSCSSPRRATSTPRATTRGVFRSTDGGATWTRTLFVDDSTGRPEAGARVRPAERHLRDDGAPLHAAAPPPGGRGGAGRVGGRRADRARPARRIYKSIGRRRHLEGDHRRRAAAHSTAATSIAVANEHERAARLPHTNNGLYPFRRRRRHVEADGRRRHAHPQRPGRLQLRRVRRSARIPTSSTSFNTSSYKSTRRRQHLHRLQGRAGRRRSAADAGSIPPTASACCSATTRARSCRSTAAPRGARGTTSRPSRSITCRVDNSFPYWVYASQQDAGADPHAHPRQPGRHHAARLESGERLGVGHSHPRSARPEHRVRERQRHHQDLLSERAVDQREPRRGPVAAAAHGVLAADRCSRRGISTS